MFITGVKSVRRSGPEGLAIMVEVLVPRGGWDSDPPTEEREFFFQLKTFLELTRLVAGPLEEILAEQVARQQGLLPVKFVCTNPQHAPWCGPVELQAPKGTVECGCGSRYTVSDRGEVTCTYVAHVNGRW